MTSGPAPALHRMPPRAPRSARSPPTTLPHDLPHAPPATEIYRSELEGNSGHPHVVLLHGERLYESEFLGLEYEHKRHAQELTILSFLLEAKVGERLLLLPPPPSPPSVPAPALLPSLAPSPRSTTVTTTTKVCLEPGVGLVGILCGCPADPHVSPTKARLGLPFRRLKSIMEQAGYVVKVRRYTTTAKLGPFNRAFSYCVLEGSVFVRPSDASSTQLRPESSSTSAKGVSDLSLRNTLTTEAHNLLLYRATDDEKRNVWLLAALVDLLVYSGLFAVTVAEFRELAVPTQVGIDLYLNNDFLMMLVQFPASLIVGTLPRIGGGSSSARLSTVHPERSLT